MFRAGVKRPKFQTDLDTSQIGLTMPALSTSNPLSSHKLKLVKTRPKHRSYVSITCKLVSPWPPCLVRDSASIS